MMEISERASARSLAFGAVTSLCLAFAATVSVSDDATAGSFKDDAAGPTSTWGGLYVGLQAGYGWGDVDSVHQESNWWNFSAPPSLFPSSLEGGVAGVHVGYNHQIGLWVIGGEVAYGKSTLEDANPSPFFPTLDRHSAEINDIFSIVGRIGYSITPSTLIYAKGGYAAAKIEVSNDDFVSGNTNLSIAENWHNGWTVGAGLERKLAPNVSLGIEYNYIQIGSEYVAMTNTGRNVAGATITTVVDPDAIHTVMLKINFRQGN